MSNALFLALDLETDSASSNCLFKCATGVGVVVGPTVGVAVGTRIGTAIGTGDSRCLCGGADAGAGGTEVLPPANGRSHQCRTNWPMVITAAMAVSSTITTDRMAFTLLSMMGCKNLNW